MAVAIKKIAGVTQATAKKIGGVKSLPTEIDGSSVDDAYLKAYYKFETGTAIDDDTAGRSNIIISSDVASVTGLFTNSAEFDGNDYFIHYRDFAIPNYYWKLNGNSTNSIGGVNGTDYNMSYGAGLYGDCGIFNGSNSRVRFSTSLLNVTTGDFTIALSFKTSASDDAYRELVCKGGNGDPGWSLHIRNGTLRLNMDDGTNTNHALPFGSVNDDEWHSIAISVDRNVGAYCYMDGEYKGLVDCTARSGSLSNTMYSFLGCYSSATQWWWDGEIDNVKFWTSALVGHPVVGTLLTLSEYCDDWRPTGNFSVGFWVKTSADPFTVVQAWTNASSVISGWVISVSSDGYVYFYSGRNNGNTEGTHYKLCNGDIVVSDGVWHHVVCVYDGSYMKVYVDGREDTSEAWTYAPVYPLTSFVRIGCGTNDGVTNSNYLTGQLDDLGIWHRALTADEIYGLYINTKKVEGVLNV